MNINVYIENSNHLFDYYRDENILKNVLIESIELMEFSPAMEIYGFIPVEPSVFNSKYTSEADAVYFNLHFYDIGHVDINNFSGRVKGEFSFSEHSDKKFNFRFLSDQMNITCNYEGCYIHLRASSEKQDSEYQQDLFQHRTLFNACLNQLKNSGWELRLVGRPDKEGRENHAKWYAEKEGFNIRANNPTELLGMSVLYDKHHGPRNDPYWWNKDDDEPLFIEIMDRWTKKNFK